MNEDKHSSHAASSAADDLKDKAAEIGQNVREMGGQIGDAAREQYENLRGKANDYYKQGRKQAAQWEEGVEEYIQDRPIHAVLMAAGIGLLLGMFWRRR
jgi:ElaB/YqjD/DUF883 family membrane-anchored ribosome-binding protein